jgi:hypothetical protein
MPVSAAASAGKSGRCNTGAASASTTPAPAVLRFPKVLTPLSVSPPAFFLPPHRVLDLRRQGCTGGGLGGRGEWVLKLKLSTQSTLLEDA